MRRNCFQKPVTAAFFRKRAFHAPFQGYKERPARCPKLPALRAEVNRTPPKERRSFSCFSSFGAAFPEKRAHIGCSAGSMGVIPTRSVREAHRVHTPLTAGDLCAALHTPAQLSASALSFAFRSTDPSPPG